MRFSGHLKIDRNLFANGGSACRGGCSEYRGHPEEARRVSTAREEGKTGSRFFVQVRQSNRKVVHADHVLPLSSVSSSLLSFISLSLSLSLSLCLVFSLDRSTSLCAPFGRCNGRRDEYALRVHGDEWLRACYYHPHPPSLGVVPA